MNMVVDAKSVAMTSEIDGKIALSGTERSIGSRALEITEILENVLQHFTALQLFGLQRVSPKFKDVISGNKAIRRKIWLDPSAPTAPVTRSAPRRRGRPTRPTLRTIMTSTQTQQNNERGGSYSLLQDMPPDRFGAFVHSDEFYKATWPLRFEICNSVIKVSIDTAKIFTVSGSFDEWSRPLMGSSLPTRSTQSWKDIILPVQVSHLELMLTSGSDLMVGCHMPKSKIKGRGGQIVTLGDAVEQVHSTAEWWYENFPGVWRVLSITLEGEHWFRKSLLWKCLCSSVETKPTVRRIHAYAPDM